MELKIEVTYRLKETRRTKSYTTETSARRGIWRWLKKHNDEPNISASYFSPNNEHQRFEHYEQLPEFEVSITTDFYTSTAWRALRYKVLSTQEHKCTKCFRTPEKHGIALHVDHIKPRSKYPQLEYDNLQILCDDCNLGKMDN